MFELFSMSKIIKLAGFANIVIFCHSLLKFAFYKTHRIQKVLKVLKDFDSGMQV